MAYTSSQEVLGSRIMAYTSSQEVLGSRIMAYTSSQEVLGRLINRVLIYPGWGLIYKRNKTKFQNELIRNKQARLPAPGLERAAEIEPKNKLMQQYQDTFFIYWSFIVFEVSLGNKNKFQVRTFNVTQLEHNETEERKLIWSKVQLFL